MAEGHGNYTLRMTAGEVKKLRDIRDWMMAGDHPGQEFLDRLMHRIRYVGPIHDPQAEQLLKR